IVVPVALARDVLFQWLAVHSAQHPHQHGIRITSAVTLAIPISSSADSVAAVTQNQVRKTPDSGMLKCNIDVHFLKSKIVMVQTCVYEMIRGTLFELRHCESMGVIYHMNPTLGD
ncbi:hypothetical protein A2U01_0004462, partial [Trifolium medium]|nr:hypothetical protein [Trifolium medium]